MLWYQHLPVSAKGGIQLRNLLFLYNPNSGKGRVAEGLASILDIFTKAGWLVTAYPTQ